MIGRAENLAEALFWTGNLVFCSNSVPFQAHGRTLIVWASLFGPYTYTNQFELPIPWWLENRVLQTKSALYASKAVAGECREGLA